MHINARVICQQDDQNQCVFQIFNLMAINNGGTTTLVGGNAAFTPEAGATGNGENIRLSILADDTNDAVAFKITAIASENWDTRVVVDFLDVTN